MKNKETLEEAAKKYANKKGDIPTTKLEDAIFKQGFIDGAKWQQQQMYSENEVHSIIKSYHNTVKNNPINITYSKWFEKFKKK